MSYLSNCAVACLKPRYFIWLTSWDATLLGLAVLTDYVLTLMLFLKRWGMYVCMFTISLLFSIGKQ